MLKYYVFCFVLFLFFFLTNCKQFGYLYLFTCHCQDDNSCTTSGECTDCSVGWFGSTCQKQNVALNKPATQSQRFNNGYTGRGPELVVDGNRAITSEVCMDTDHASNRWWSVNLQNTYPIRQIHIIYRIGYLYTLEGFKIDVIQADGSQTECYQQKGDVSSNEFTVTCNNVIWGNGINISSTSGPKHFLLFCEVDVYVCSNRTYGENCEKFCYCKDIVSCDDVTGECPTEECLPGFSGSSCNEKCSSGSYGKGCLSTCSTNCRDSLCYHITGKCINGCKPGYTLDNCEKECENGVYGIGCSLQCSSRNCLYQSTCAITDGECAGGCQDGYSGLDCISKSSVSGGNNINGPAGEYTSVVIGSAISIVVLGLIVVILGVCYFRRRLSKDSGNPHVNDNTETSVVSHPTESRLQSDSSSPGHDSTNHDTSIYQDVVNTDTNFSIVEDATTDESTPDPYNSLDPAYQIDNTYETINI